MKASQAKAIERLYRRKVAPDTVVSHELSTELSRLSHSMGIQLGILINRAGTVDYVIAGTASGISIPKLNRRRSYPGRLLGLRLIHTHLNAEGLSTEDLVDLTKLRLDMIYAISVKDNGEPELAYGAHLIPDDSGSTNWKLLDAIPTYAIDIRFDQFVRELEDDFVRKRAIQKVDVFADRAIIIMVCTALNEMVEIRKAELQSLVQAAGIKVLNSVVQKRPKVDPKYVVGKGRLSQLYIDALRLDANLLVFDHELSPSQARSIFNLVDMRVVDRTQVILDIFASRANTREGKIQVELAQLRYNMPHLVGKNPSLSRLAGGIGTRGPGETKLEIDRRRANERIARLEREIVRVSQKRKLTRQKRSRNVVPVISIIGYTNTGKSTLLNSLTRSHVLTADMPFATLDPSSKRLRFPRDFEVIITDTVGFIRDLPDDLQAAFRATLEELSDAQLLLEVIDLTDPHIEYRIQAVDDILKGLALQNKPRLKVFNKADKCDRATAMQIASRFDGVAVSALDRSSLPALTERMQAYFFES